MIWHIVLGMALDMSTYYIYPSRQPVPPSWATWRSCPCLSNQHHRQVLQLATWKRRTRRRCRAPQAPTPWCSPSTRPSTSSTLLGQGWDYQIKKQVILYEKMILRACHLRGFTRQRSSSTLSYRVRLPRLTITFPSCLFPRCEWTWRDFFLEQTISLKGRGWRGWGHWRGPNWERESSECSWRRHELCCGDQVKEIDRYKICACKKYFYNTLILWLGVVVTLLLIELHLILFSPRFLNKHLRQSS